MSTGSAGPPGPETASGASEVTVNYWASARAAAGLATEQVPVADTATLADLVELVVARHSGTRLGPVLEVCSVLLGERPVGAVDPATVRLSPGDVVEFLPPFAGG